MSGARPTGRTGRPGSIANADEKWGGESRLRRLLRRPSRGPRTPARSSQESAELARAKARIAEVERLVGRQHADLRFFSRSLAALGRDEPKRRRAHLYVVIQEMIAAEPQGFLKDDANIARLCRLGGVSRAGYHRHFGPHPPKREDADLRDLIQRVVLENRHYGYRRVAQELVRMGLIVDAKRVLRLMRADNLLALRAKPFVPRTTDSRHAFVIAPNRTRDLVPTGLAKAAFSRAEAPRRLRRRNAPASARRKSSTCRSRA